jgi:hypothetical protein
MDKLSGHPTVHHLAGGAFFMAFYIRSNGVPHPFLQISVAGSQKI